MISIKVALKQINIKTYILRTNGIECEIAGLNPTSC